MSENLTRQKDIIPMEVLGEKITIIGAGAIGGWTALALAKMGFCDITVWDFDNVDTVNMNSQLYRIRDIGRAKVDALQDIVLDFTGTKITTKNKPYKSGKSNGIVISAVDSMEVRKLIWENHKDWPMTRAVIDPRMGAEQALLYVSRPSLRGDHESYEKTLYDDSEAIQERCTAKATIYTANLLSGLVCKAVKDELTSQEPLRNAEWNIKANAFLGFNRKACYSPRRPWRFVRGARSPPPWSPGNGDRSEQRSPNPQGEGVEIIERVVQRMLVFGVLIVIGASAIAAGNTWRKAFPKKEEKK